MSRKGCNGGAQGFQRNGGNADVRIGVFGQNRVHHRGHAALGAANEHGIRGSQGFQCGRGTALNEGEVPRRKFFAVPADEGAGVRLTLHRIHMPLRGGQCQLHAHAAGARPHIPQGIAGLHGQLGQRRRPHLLLGHGHLSPVEGFIREAGHPIPDENSFTATQQALDLVSGLTAQDTVLFLLSGGGSALFEKPLIPAADLEELTHNLLVCGADIVEINTLRKRFSGVKGGRFAQLCAPAHVVSIVLSDILGDPLDMIASGPAYPDSSTCTQAKEIVQKYHLPMTEQMLALLEQETPKALDNVETQITGSVRQLCAAAAATARTLGYEPLILTDCLSCEAREAGVFLANMVRYQRTAGRRIALIAGGETVVHLTGHGKGGRNQELALAAAPGIAGLDGCAVSSVGSDGTDGPTDAAGGFVDSTTQAALKAQGCDIFATLADNDAYHALQKCNGLIITGPTGTNVNDVSVALVRA